MTSAPEAVDKSQIIRDAATIVLIRDAQTDTPKVLMGQRGAGAAFMPSKYVFPGGAVDADDRRVALTVAGDDLTRLALDPVTETPPAPQALVAAAIRELWEEAGFMLAQPGTWSDDVPDDWQAFADLGLVPHGEALRYIFRAVTPPGRTRRFDARFFLAMVDDVMGDPDDFSQATDELGHLHWIPLAEARQLDLPFITEVVLAEAEAHLRDGPSATVPFFDNSGESSRFRRLG